MSGYWIDDPDNPFNRMSYTRGGGGYDNRETRESNDRRASAMMGAGASALPHYANIDVAIKASPGLSYAVVGDYVVRTDGRNRDSGGESRGAGSGPGVAVAATGAGGRGTGGRGAGSQLVLSGPYKPGFSPGVLNWQLPMQFTNAPEVDGIANKPLERVGIGGAQEAPGSISDIGWARTHSGGFIVVPSQDVKERIEDDFFTQSQWSWRNVWGPSIGVIPQPRPDFLEPGRSYFDFWSGEWREGSKHGLSPGGGGGW